MVGMDVGDGVGDKLYDFGKFQGQNPLHPNDRAAVVIPFRVLVVTTVPNLMQLVLS